jgi:hypothetical protein
MTESNERRVHVEDLVLDIGEGVGALVLYTGPEYVEREIEISPIEDDNARVHTAVHARQVRGQVVIAGVFPQLPGGRYRLWGGPPDAPDQVVIGAGQVAELDWRIAPGAETSPSR